MSWKPAGGAFLHCADIHLDSPLHGLARYEGAPEMENATRKSFESLVDFAIENDVDAVVIAGDLYDGERDDWATAVFLQRQLARLSARQIPVVIAWGNHDAANDLTHRLQPPENVHVLSSREPETFVLESPGLAFHGQSYPRRDIRDNLALSYPDPVEGMLNVGVLHTALRGSEGHEPYAPCSQSDLAQKGYHYWALGHVHQRQVIQPDEEGKPWIVYPGNLQGRQPRESGSKGATLVHYQGNRVTSCEHIPLCVLEWQTIELETSALPSPREDEDDSLQDKAFSSVVEEILSACIARAKDAQAEAFDRGAEILALRFLIPCSEPAYSELVYKREDFRTQLQADVGDSIWVERIDIIPSTDRQPLPSGDLAARVQEIVNLALANRETARELTSGLGPLQRLLSGLNRPRSTHAYAELLEAAGLDPDFLEEPSRIFEEAEALLLHRLDLAPTSRYVASGGISGEQDVD